MRLSMAGMSLVGPTGGATAQKLACNRLAETICVKLISAHQGQVQKPGGPPVLRWAQVVQEYRHVRQRLLDSRHVQQGSDLALPDVSHKTLLTWYNDLQRRRKAAVVQKGVVPPPWRQLAPKPLAAACPLLTALPQTPQPAMVLILPENTTGQVAAGIGLGRQLGQRQKRTYTRRAVSVRCAVCQRPRTATLGHRRDKQGRFFCPHNPERLSFEQWAATDRPPVKKPRT
ncbi:uncharacterized protein LOC119114713 [Pollicipes pollicipes]|uniref:uncharacterized protein LOC119114713 n=1 Tax=Pollicipes pollicipes TaxID=41117 RepID=UPI0018855F38|nr:uncharacterized protein LOC119114713 [Pollicipes pollicipes]